MLGRSLLYTTVRKCTLPVPAIDTTTPWNAHSSFWHTFGNDIIEIELRKIKNLMI